MNAPKPKQLTMKRLKQRNIVVPRYMLRPDLRKFYNNMTKAEIFERLNKGARHEEEQNHEKER